MEIRAEEITRILREQLGGFTASIDVAETGAVLSVGDGIARIDGLERCMAGELLELPHGVMGLAMNLEEDGVGAVLLGEYQRIREGDQVRRTRRRSRTPSGGGSRRDGTARLRTPPPAIASGTTFAAGGAPR